MRLSELDIINDGVVYRDGFFSGFGTLSCAENDIISYVCDKRFLELIDSNITCIICRDDYLELLPYSIQGIIVSDTPETLFWKLHNQYGCKNITNKTTQIGKDCVISPKASIAAEGVVIGDRVHIEDFVCINSNTTLGNDVIIRSGSIIGGSGFEYKRKFDNSIISVEHYGGIIIGDDVEIQQMCSIERSVFQWDDTVIGCGTKIGGSTVITHGCKLGSNCLVAAKCLICGSTKIGDRAWLGPNVNISSGIVIGDDTYISFNSTVRVNIDNNMAFLDGRIMKKELFEALKRQCFNS